MSSRKLTDQEWSTIVSNLIYFDKRSILYPFLRALQGFILMLDHDIEVSDEKDISDLYIEYNNGNIIVKGTLTKIDNKTNKIRQWTFDVAHIIFMYMNRQPQRGKGKEAQLWFKSLCKLNHDLYGINYPETYYKLFKDADTIINKVKEKLNNYSYSEEENYKILKEMHNSFNNMMNNFLQKLQQVIQQLDQMLSNNSGQNQQKQSNNNSNCNCNNQNNNEDGQNSQNDNNSSTMSKMASLRNKLEKIHNDLVNKGYTDNDDIEQSKNLNDSNPNSKLKKEIKDLLDKLQNSEMNSKNIPVNWHEKSANDEQGKESGDKISDIIHRSLRTSFEKLKGELPGHIVDKLRKILKIELDWTDILSRALNTFLEKSQAKKWSYPNIYFRHIRYLPSNDDEEVIHNIACFVDTSGSMSDKELQKIFGIIYDLIEKNDVKTITIVQHDYELQHYELIDTEDINDSKDMIDRIKIYGRGGTSHVKPWEKFEELIEMEELPFPDLVIFMSDFYSDFEELYNKIKDDYECFCITTDAIPKINDKFRIIKIRD
jgi:hypothetical protein